MQKKVGFGLLFIKLYTKYVKLKQNDTKQTLLIRALCKLGLQPQHSEKGAEVTRGNLKKTKAIGNICISWFSVDGASQTSQDVSNA